MRRILDDPDSRWLVSMPIRTRRPAKLTAGIAVIVCQLMVAVFNVAAVSTGILTVDIGLRRQRGIWLGNE
jgi:hypothetical protein